MRSLRGLAGSLRAFVAPTLILMALCPHTAAALSTRTIVSTQAAISGTQMGGSVAPAGDFNGDGFPDVVMGAVNTSFNSFAPLFLGGPGADATADLNFLGEAVTDMFGKSVAGVGDVNGDGFDDVVIGAPLNDAAGVNAGRAYLYLGGATPNSVADQTFTGLTAGDLFGWAVAGAGDVNGDGFDDILIGAPTFGGADDGRAYLFLGGVSVNNVIDVTYVGAGGENGGLSVAGIGDINGDGFDDVAIGGPLDDGNGVNAGRVRMFPGAPTPASSASLTIPGEAAGDQFGTSVAGLGDMNGDGSPDFGIGAPFHTVGGRAYVYAGGGALDATAELTLSTVAAGANFGFCVGAAGDVNGDGLADLAVGASIGGFAGQGQVTVYLGGTSFNAVSDLTLTGSQVGDAYGQAVGTAGDFDDDGYADLLVGAPGNDVGVTDVGHGYVVLVYPYQLIAPNGGESLTAGAAAAVQWRGHDVADIALSVDNGLTYTTLATGVGGAEDNSLVIALPATPTHLARIRVNQTAQTVRHSGSDASENPFTIGTPAAAPAVAARAAFFTNGASAGDQFGASVAALGDVNGDGQGDWAVGIPFSDVSAINAGRAQVFFGGPGADNVADLTINGTGSGDIFGSVVGAAGDFNGDGQNDFFVTAPLGDASASDGGQVRVFFGGPGVGALTGISFQGGIASQNEGSSAAGVGDVNGDGYADLVLGLSGHAANSGEVVVAFGGPFGTGSGSQAIATGGATEAFGNSVAGGSDYNGDGIPDFVVGAPFSDVGAANAGRAYVYFGRIGRTLDGTPDLIITGTGPQDDLGLVVADLGDVNGDGFGDFAVGSAFADFGALDNGVVELFLGGPALDATPDLVLTGIAQSSDFFGRSLVSAGDLNRDGYADFLVGVSNRDSGAGRALVYFGGPIVDPVPDLEIPGAAGEALGMPLAAGDLLGDGFPDILLGVPQNDVAGADAGRVYLRDTNRYFLTSPNLPTTWNVGSTQSVQWLGAEPARVFLSVDGGASYSPLADGGGQAENALAIRVPHLPTKFARIRVAPADPTMAGADESDSLFTIRAGVNLLSLTTIPLERGVQLVWATEPAVGPDGLAGYRLYRTPSGGGPEQRVGDELIRTPGFTDPDGTAGARYRLSAVNGLGEELELGQVATTPPIVGLALWPSPARAGAPLHLLFPAPRVALPGAGSNPATPATDVDVAIFDVMGRRIASIGRNTWTSQGDALEALWDGRLDSGRTGGSGVYWARVTAPSAGVDLRRKFVRVR